MGLPRKMYWNPKQQLFLEGRQPLKLFLGGRGSGKTHSLGINQRAKLASMPKSKGFLAAATYNQIMTKTLPAMINSWSLFGLIEGEHYVIGVQPPKWFDKPLSPPKKFANVISFFNGRCVEMVSLDRPDLVRGGSYDDGDIDEAALLKHENWTKILLPATRGNRHIFRNKPHHHQVCFYTSIPWKPSGYWIMEFEEKQKAYPDEYFVVEATAYDNIDILGQKGIDRMKREMPYSEFQVEVMNERVIRVEGCFYEALNLERHTYTPKYTYKQNDVGLLVTDRAHDYDSDQPLDTTWDFGGWFNCVGVWQEEDMIERMINSFHGTTDASLRKVVNDLCNHYSDHRNRLIRIWGEPRGHDRRPSTPSIYEQIADMFEARGWTVVIMVQPGYATKKQAEHREFINTILGEQDGRLPKVRINEETNRSPLIALQSTETDKDGGKDKSKERDRGFPQEHATHYTDGFDYYLMQKHGWRLMEDTYNEGPGEAIVI